MRRASLVGIVLVLSGLVQGCGRARATERRPSSGTPLASAAAESTAGLQRGQPPAPSAVASTSEPPLPGGAPPVPARATVTTQAARGPYNVVLIVIDSLRADMPWAGYRRNVAPRLSALERRAVSYTRAYSISSVTARSVGPLLVGKYPSEMLRTGRFFTTYYPDNLFVGERLQPAGHHTLAVLAHAYFTGGGMRQGFDDYKVLSSALRLGKETEPTSERTTRAAQRAISRAAADREHRFFAYLHYMDPHAEYLDHEREPDYGDSRRDRYDREVHHTDRWVGALVGWLAQQPFGASTAVIVTADHGEAFGEHGHYRHGYELWEALVHVPLLLVVPGAAPRRIDVPRSHVDLAPTILELMGVPASPPLRGKSLVAELFGAEPAARPVVVDLPRDDLEDRRRAVIDGNLKLIARGDDERWLLYDLSSDPHERKNLTGARRDDFERMKRLYFELSAEIPNVEVRGDVPLAKAPPGRRW